MGEVSPLGAFSSASPPREGAGRADRGQRVRFGRRHLTGPPRHHRRFFSQFIPINAPGRQIGRHSRGQDVQCGMASAGVHDAYKKRSVPRHRTAAARGLEAALRAAAARLKSPVRTTPAAAGEVAVGAGPLLRRRTSSAGIGTVPSRAVSPAHRDDGPRPARRRRASFKCWAITCRRSSRVASACGSTSFLAQARMGDLKMPTFDTLQSRRRPVRSVRKGAIRRCHVLNEAVFRSALIRERKRADRSNRPLILSSRGWTDAASTLKVRGPSWRP